MLEGRVCIVTGAGRGLGREHALLFARHGAKVLVNDLGGDIHGEGVDKAPAQAVADEIRSFGGEAVANTDDVADWEGARRIINQAVETFGDLHVLVNNAGILRDRMLVNMSELEWDSVIKVHLKGHFCPTRHAFGYWRERSKSGDPIKASVVHTTSVSGVLGAVGQSNYGAAKIGITAFSSICALEGARYGIRSNAVAPAARTRLAESTPGTEEALRRPDDDTVFDVWDPANVSPMIAYLATTDCPFTGETFYAFADLVARFQPFIFAERISNGGKRWTIEKLASMAGQLDPGDKRRGGIGEFDPSGMPSHLE
jgi:NAD(P)-dependent dehydrogenase (short-subunit alcohol dehydrogenase family)